MNLETQLKEGERSLGRLWKVTALRGVLATAFAVVILIWSSIGLTALIALFGAFALVSRSGRSPGRSASQWSVVNASGSSSKV
jgi:uncharacterized membrane protein HdeD (DUF308 family)